MENVKPRQGKKRQLDNGFDIWKDYKSSKVAKLQSQSNEYARNVKSDIFKGISIFVNGYTDPAADELKRIILANGGKYHHYYSKSQTTHIIASNLPNSKVISQNTDNVVSPKWITESMAAGHLLYYKKFLLYTNQSSSQPQLNFLQIDYKLKKKELITLSDENNLVDTIADAMSSECISVEKPVDSADQLIDSSDNNCVNETEVICKNKAISKDLTPAQHCDLSISLSTSNPNFITEFYNNSRLHYLSTAGAMFKQYVKDLQSQENDFKGREALKAWLKRNNFKKENNFEKVIMHIDMDCFFVSVGLIKYPELSGQPVAVTHARNSNAINRNKDDFNYELSCIKDRYKGNDSKVINANILPMGCGIEISTFDLLDGKSSMSEIASCSYEARQKGIKNGMLLGAARKLCPQLKTIPYDFEGYEGVSKKLYDIVASYSKVIDAVSCDEMFVDLTDVLNECSVSPMNLATYLRNEIKVQTQCSSSIGLGPNMLIARLATYCAKPNGQYFVDDVDEFMKKQKVSNLPGVGGSLCRRLTLIGILTCGDLQAFSLEYLQKNFGSQTGKSLYDFCRGRDERKINIDHQRKSVSAEINYGIRFQNLNDADKFVHELSKEVSKRLTDLSLQGKTITLKLKVRAKKAPIETAKFMGHGICDNFSKSFTVHTFTSDTEVIYKVAMTLLKQMTLKYEDLRGVGIQVSKLTEKKLSGSNSVSSIKTFLKPRKSIQEIRDCDHKRSLENHPKHSNVTAVSYDDNNVKPMEEKSAVHFLDPEVLSALPAEIRLQVIEEYESHGYHVPFKAGNEPGLKLQSVIECKGNTLNKVIDNQSSMKKQFTSLQPGSSCSNLSPQPGPSRLSDIPLKREPTNVFVNSPLSSSEENDDRNQKNSTKNPAEYLITSYSQINCSFFDDLPIDIKEDLKKDIEMQKNSISKLGAMSKTAIMKPLELSDKSEKRIKGLSANSENCVVSQKNKKLFISKKKKNCINEVSQKKDNEAVESECIKEAVHLLPELYNKVPNLCGEIEVPCVKSLINKWIQSCENPDSFDVEMLAAYCNELVMDKDLEKLELILKFINRKTKLSTVSWQVSYKDIINKVQNKMIEIYNAKLLIDFS